MRITLHTDYALRTLMLLAIEPDRLHTIEEISTRYGISRNHLMKVVQTLAQGGFVASLRGRSGGLRLAHAPEAINLGDVIRVTEDNFHLVECFSTHEEGCVISPACQLRSVLHEALNAFLAVLDKYTLADLVKNPARLREMRALLAAE